MNNTSTIEISDILSIIAIVISVFGFFFSRISDSFFNGPKCRIAVFSIEKGLQIQMENVGNRIMRVKSISYTSTPEKKNSYKKNLSSFFYEIPCETRSEARPINQALFPNSKHKLLTTTFDSQDKLMKAWEIAKSLTVKVEYCGPIKRFKPTYISLKDAHETFLDALKDENGNNRQLKAFRHH